MLEVTQAGQYDAAGNRASRTDFLGRTTSYEYDALNRLLWKRLPGGAVVGYTYSATGQVASVTAGRGTTLYAYDARDRLARVTHPDGAAIEYGYDAAGNRTSVKSTVGAVSRITTYAYDALNRLASVTDPSGRTTSWTYDAAGNRKTQTLPNGVVSTWGYDNRHRLTSIEHRKADASLIASYAYTLSGTGQRSQVVETTPAGTRTVAYTYDALYRLTGETVTAGAATTTTLYQYDSTGNRTRVTVNGVVSSYFYDQNDRMYFEGNNAVAFDANGNMLGLPSKGATYAYDPEDRLTKATHTAGATVDYAYDGEGARIETKVTQGAATSTTKHLIDKNRAYAEVIEERDEAGTLLAVYTHGHDLEGPVSQERFSGGTGVVSYYLTDHLGSTRFLVDATGNVTDTYLYEPYGTVSQRTGTTPNSYQFTGEQFDQATGMTYLRARWMANGVARFVTVDPHPGAMRIPATLNDYVYGNANPVAIMDPSGRMGLAGMVGVSIGVTFVAAGIYSLNQFYANGQRVESASAQVAGLQAIRCPPDDLNSAGMTRCRVRGLPVIRFGQDVLEQTNHILRAQQAGYHPEGALHRRMPPHKDWVSLARRKGGRCNGGSSTQQCDEYPMKSTMEGGEDNFLGGSVSVDLISAVHNMLGGTRLNQFYSKGPGCNIGNGDAFLVVPQPGRPFTNWSCN